VETGPVSPAPHLQVEDELPIRRFLRASLARDGYRLVEAETGQQALKLAAKQPPDLVILDLGVPDMDGREVLRRLREWLGAPILILFVRDQEQQKITALDQGADDYLAKSFTTSELLARIPVALRRSARVGDERESSAFACGDLKIDLAARRVLVKGTEVHLTPIEY
jgi:two-component system KDP operon response regulator KdpE